MMLNGDPCTGEGEVTIFFISLSRVYRAAITKYIYLYDMGGHYSTDDDDGNRECELKFSAVVEAASQWQYFIHCHFVFIIIILLNGRGATSGENGSRQV